MSEERLPAEPGEDGELDLDLDNPEPDEPEPEPGEEPEPEAEPEPDEPRQQQRQRPSRSERHHRQLADKDREINDLRQQLSQRQQQPAAPPPDPMAQQRADQEFWARMEELPPAQVAREVAAREQQRFSQALIGLQLQTRDEIDQQAFSFAAQSSRLHQQYRPEVERELAAYRAQGNFTIRREQILHQLVGRDAIARSQRAAPAQQRRGQQQVARQTTRPPSGRGDVATAGRRDRQDAEDERLLRELRAGDI